jgi:RimJ/RimL family protein N-acetyltransferase
MSPLSELHPWPQWDEVELGYVLARHAQGRGLAAEAARVWRHVA